MKQPLNSGLSIVRLSDAGKLRERNEDTVASDDSIGMALLADGMGGYNAGDVASQMASLTITAELKAAFSEALHTNKSLSTKQVKNHMSHAIDIANDAIYRVAQSQPQCAGMGTTIVTAIFRDNQAVIGHIGDSRAYRFRNKNLLQLTDDHSLVQEHVKSGLVSESDAAQANYKNYLTKALGISKQAELEMNVVDAKPKDIFLLCSDGLTEMLSNDEIESILLENNNLALAAETLVENANYRGGRDNISVILIGILESFASLHQKSWLKSIMNKVTSQ